MIFKLTATDSDAFKQLPSRIEINTVEELVTLTKAYNNPIVISERWNKGLQPPNEPEYEIEIYNNYRE